MRIDGSTNVNEVGVISAGSQLRPGRLSDMGQFNLDKSWRRDRGGVINGGQYLYRWHIGGSSPGMKVRRVIAEGCAVPIGSSSSDMNVVAAIAGSCQLILRSHIGRRSTHVKVVVVIAGSGQLGSHIGACAVQR